MTTAEFAELAGAERSGNGWKAKCPAHDDHHPSLSINEGRDGRTVVHCHAGCPLAAILAKFGLQERDLFPRPSPQVGLPPSRGSTVKTYYYYHDERGELLWRVVRSETSSKRKRFHQERPDGRGGWILGVAGVRQVPYRLPECIGKDEVSIVEGEKDVDALRAVGVPATTNAGGAGKWHDEHSRRLKSVGVKRVNVFPDNDEPGRRHAEQVARSCRAAGLEVRIVELPGLPSKGDVSDWLAADHTPGELQEIVRVAWTRPGGSPDDRTGAAGASIPSERPAVTLTALLTDVERYVRLFVVLSDDQAAVLALWIAHTHAIDAFDCTPYLQITSATKRAGKTRLLEVLEPVVARPWFTGRTSAAALVRKIDREQSTLLLDESDAAFKAEREYTEALRGILNSGYRRSGKATVCIGQGAKIEVRDFKTFSPKAIAGIGRLPDTVADRSIPIQLKRRTSAEPCAKWRERDGHAEAAPLHDALTRWAGGALETLRAARPSLPEDLSDRAADCWEPLFAIADLAGPEWGARARRAALALMGADGDADPVVELLTDIKEILATVSGDTIQTKVLLGKLVAREDRPWATWRHGKEMTAHSLARLLGPLGCHPVSLGSVRGYRVDAFYDPIARYLGSQVSKCQNINNDGQKGCDTCDFCEGPGNASAAGFGPDSIGSVTHRHFDQGEAAIGGDGPAPVAPDSDDLEVRL